MRGLDLDTLTKEQIESLEKRGGNQVINRTLQKYLYPYERIDPGCEMKEREIFIKRKYQERAFVNPREEKDEPDNRICYYFMTFQYGKIRKLENENKRTIFDRKWTPILKDQYPGPNEGGPEIDPGLLPMLTFPDDIKMQRNNPGQEIRKYVSTDATARKAYGVSLVFYELVSYYDLIQLFKAANLDVPPKDLKVWAPKGISILSAWPFFNQFGKFLETLYRIYISDSSPLPLERFVANFFYRVPVPPKGLYIVQYELAGQPIQFSRAPVNALALTDKQVNFLQLFQSLYLKDIVNVWRALTFEWTVVLASSCQNVLLDCAHTLLSLLYPFNFCGIYLPVLPRQMLTALHSPVHCLAGVHPDWLKERDVLPDECVVVYLDEWRVVIKQKTRPWPDLPPRAEKKLKTSLYQLYQTLSLVHEQPNVGSRPTRRPSQWNKFVKNLLPLAEIKLSGNIVAKSLLQDSKEDTESAAVSDARNAFVRFWTFALQHYWEQDGVVKRFFAMNSNGYEFQINEFLFTEIPKAHPKWFKVLTETQMWQNFIQEREDFLNDPRHTPEHIKNDIQFFNQLIIKKVDRKIKRQKRPTPFLAQDFRHMKTFACEPPSDSNLPPDKRYTYTSFPKLNPDLFYPRTSDTPVWKIQPDGTRGRQMSSKTMKALGELMAMNRAQSIANIRSWDTFYGTLLQIQSYARGYLASEKFKATIGLIRTQQARLRGRYKADPIFKQFQERRKKTVILQASIRGYLYFKYNQELLEKRITISIQSWIRAKMVAERYRKRRYFAVTIQAALKTAHRFAIDADLQNAVATIASRLQWLAARKTWLRQRQQICTIQARLRGVLMRNRQKALINEKMSECKTDLLSLWTDTFTLRSTRAQFLTIFEEATYLNLAIHKEEVRNLRESLEYKDGLEPAEQRFNIEGEELRRTLRGLPDALKNSFYERLGIAVNSRQRKRQLLEIIWTENVSMEDSKELTLLIVPQRSINAAHSESQCHLRKNKRIQRVLLEIVQGYIISMNNMHHQLTATEHYSQKLQTELKSIKEELQRERFLSKLRPLPSSMGRLLPKKTRTRRRTLSASAGLLKTLIESKPI